MVTEVPTLSHLNFMRYAARIAQRSASWAADTADVVQHLDVANDPISSVRVARYLEDMRAFLDHIEHEIKDNPP